VADRLILGLDNSLDFLNIALSREEELLEERHIRPLKSPSETITDEVTNILAGHGALVEDLSLIVVTLGPGSFTGIRVGLAFCKGLAAGRNIPLVGLPTLDVLTYPFSFCDEMYLCPLLDAKKGEVFCALYQASGNRPELLTNYKALKPQEVPTIIKPPCLCFGSGVAMCESHLSPLPGIKVVKQGFSRISGEALIQAGLAKTLPSEHHDLKPIYGRRSEAEIKFGVKVL